MVMMFVCIIHPVYIWSCCFADGENPTFSPVWLPDITCNNCMLCNTEFTIIRRKVCPEGVITGSFSCCETISAV